MLEEMADLDEKMKSEIQNLLTSTPEVVPEAKSIKKKSTKKKLKILDKVRKQNPNDSEEEDKNNKTEDFTTDERIALEIYEAMRAKKGKQNEDDSEEENEDDP